VIVTARLWAKPVWGIWWTWDARLTLTFVLWLLFVAYLMLRSYVINPGRSAVLAAVVGIIGFVDVPIDYMAIRWWRTQHPSAGDCRG
jgi:heme exporter protein C